MRTFAAVDLTGSHAGDFNRDDLALRLIQQRVHEARLEAAQRWAPAGFPFRELTTKSHFMLRVSRGKFSGELWWKVIDQPAGLASATAHADSGKAIRETSRVMTYTPSSANPATRQYVKNLERILGIERPTDAELATMPSPIAAPHSPNCPCGACSGKAYRGPRWDEASQRYRKFDE